jgi:hypothetical protein
MVPGFSTMSLKIVEETPRRTSDSLPPAVIRVTYRVVSLRPTKFRVSISASTSAFWPGAIVLVLARPRVQPHEACMSTIVIGSERRLVNTKECLSFAPRAIGPKSKPGSEKSESVQPPARAGDGAGVRIATAAPTSTTRKTCLCTTASPHRKPGRSRVYFVVLSNNYRPEQPQRSNLRDDAKRSVLPNIAAGRVVGGQAIDCHMRRRLASIWRGEYAQREPG